MAATEMFESFTGSLSEREREVLKEVIRIRREDLLAARSEDARVRVVEGFISDVHAFHKQHRK